MGLILPGLGLIFWMSLAFLVVFVLLKKFAWGPILSSLKERETKIDDALKAAELAESRMKDIQAQNENLLAEAAKEREVMLRTAREASEKMINEAKEKANAEAAKIVEEGRMTIHNEKMKALTEIKNEVGQLSLEIAEKILRERLSNEELQKESIKKLLNEASFN
ncbi:MAG TPA: F0F1 ATP synthase subunit B [Sphingobacteriaceae bacterium]|nr:F0F1 ATP synthase subunit B [Sphingobacteriaceae bacterium]